VLNTEDPEEQQLHHLSFQRLQFLNFEMKRALAKIQEAFDPAEKGAYPDPAFRIAPELKRFQISPEGGPRPRIIYADPQEGPSQTSLLPVLPEWLQQNPDGLVSEEVWIDGLLPSKVIDTVQSRMKKAYERLVQHKKYDPEVLYQIRDFRTLVALHYVTRLARTMGISTPLDPVLSFPLGANAISILEGALAYQTMMTGTRFPLLNGKAPGMVPVIKRILDREGTVIWEYQPRVAKVLDEAISGQISEILRMVMVAGTGRRAKDAVRLVLDVEREKVMIPIPAFGKTGTANQFTNSSFVGLIPGEKEGKGLEVQKGYVIAAYVGYDDNRPMKGKHTAIYGASGALPLWIDTANAIVNSHAFKERLEVADLAFDTDWIGLGEKQGFRQVLVSPRTGLPAGSPLPVTPAGLLELYAFANGQADQVKLNRLFQPIQGEYHGEMLSD